VAVGGTDFSDTYSGTVSQYWKKNNNNATFGSAKTYIPEIPWNDSCASTLITNVEGYNVPYGANGFCNSSLAEEYFETVVSGSGGPSNCAYGHHPVLFIRILRPAGRARGMQAKLSGWCVR
jgi:hypothetical protein